MDTMYGMTAADVERWSPRVVVVRGQNPGPFTGPGTNTYLIGSGDRPLLLDTGSGVASYLPLLEQSLREECGASQLGDVLLTHVHPDHIGGVSQVLDAFGPRRVFKAPWPERDDGFGLELTTIRDGDRFETEGAHLVAYHTPGHALDHMCFLLEEERALFTGDVILGVGTTVIPLEGGDMGTYLETLRRIADLDLARIYPGHGPAIDDPGAKVEEYIAHRLERERQVLEALQGGERSVEKMVERIYVDTPRALHAAAGMSVRSHLLKLEGEKRVARSLDAAGEEHWSIR